jgi:succinate dehydrogenase hydrophobic anchor subunit
VVERVVVGAHYGLRDWLAQRITAAIMAVYTVIVLVVLIGGAPLSYAVWLELFTLGWSLNQGSFQEPFCPARKIVHAIGIAHPR